MTRRFDEPALIVRLDRAPPRARALFAASMAEHLFPLYDAYGESAGRGHPALRREGLDAAWDATDRDAATTELADFGRPGRSPSFSEEELADTDVVQAAPQAIADDLDAAVEVARRSGDASRLRRGSHAAGLRLAELVRS